MKAFVHLNIYNLPLGATAIHILNRSKTNGRDSPACGILRQNPAHCKCAMEARTAELILPQIDLVPVVMEKQTEGRTNQTKPGAERAQAFLELGTEKHLQAQCNPCGCKKGNGFLQLVVMSGWPSNRSFCWNSNFESRMNGVTMALT